MTGINQKALHDIRVVDLSRVLAGPYCGQLLADFGADVIKVEAPGGDENRVWPPIVPSVTRSGMPSQTSANFNSVNRGKRSLVLDLKTPAAREVLQQLVRQSDVLLHSFLPDTAARLGISNDALRAANKRLVVATISGFGAHGELAERRGYDMMAQAFAGMMSVTGQPGGPPIRCGASIVDMATGISLYGGIVTALLQRVETGEGTWVHGSLLETAVSLMGHFAVGWMQAGVLPQPQGSGSSVIAPYQAFKCQDGMILAGAPNDGAWARFCDALECPELAKDPRFQGNMARVERLDTLIPLLAPRFAAKPMAYWLERLESRNVACAPIHTLDQVMTHPQVLANAMRIQVKDTAGQASDVLGTPFKLADGGGTATTAAPTLGADTDVLMRTWLGMDDTGIAALRSAGAFGA
ncbi:CaiB/BaiF CoA transferase family protein [Rhodopila sp.]|jgi:crotonobetainyl-CoA:carnitine CoA-transferase CaiB-like acyl-CoA transferase|uniref:CaiB/BaiF CoA transferase family protein n=1 Tax=Rhodopila sp. TaxID=2480087 RepID=UPI002C6C3DD2|nr:CoA transferase [Rhodopila sp.]HVZ09107.1 CoA transferase [Rhodopila sp.]